MVFLTSCLFVGPMLVPIEGNWAYGHSGPVGLCWSWQLGGYYILTGLSGPCFLLFSAGFLLTFGLVWVLRSPFQLFVPG